MRCTLERAVFAQTLQLLAAIVGGRSVIPIVQNVLLHAENGTLALSSTNLEMYERCVLSAEVVEPGDVTVPAKSLLTLSANMAGDRISIETEPDGCRCTVKTESTCFSLIGLPPQGFPEFPSIRTATEFVLSQRSLTTLLNNVFYAVSRDESAPAPWTGIFLKFDADTVTSAATNSKCLAVFSDYLDTPVPQPKSMILPLNVAMELKRHLGSRGVVKISLDEGAGEACFHIGDNTVVFAKLIVGVFPDYRRIVPTSFSKEIVFSPAVLLKSIQLIAMTLRGQRSVVLKMNRRGLTVCGNSATIGSGSDFIPVEYPYEDEVEIMLSVDLLSNPLMHVSAQSMKMRINSSVAQVMLSSDDGFMFLLAPMRSL